MQDKDDGLWIDIETHDQELREAIIDQITEEVTERVTKSVTEELTDKAIENLICNFNFTNEQLKTTYPEVSDEHINEIRASIK